jgi:transcriptional regulator with XRE-family HTH domain
VFSKLLNPLDYDPTYPKKPTNLVQYIRKYRKEKGLLIREFAEKLGIHKFTLIKWEGGRMPRYQKQIRALREGYREWGGYTVKRICNTHPPIFLTLRILRHNRESGPSLQNAIAIFQRQWHR